MSGYDLTVLGGMQANESVTYVSPGPKLLMTSKHHGVNFHSYILTARRLTKIAQLHGDHSSKESVPPGGSERSMEVFKQKPDEILTQMTLKLFSALSLL